MGKPIVHEILDHGYLFKVEHWGSDERIIEAARMSTNKGFKGWGPLLCEACTYSDSFGKHSCKKCKGTGFVPGDEKLLSYLWNNRHATPFEMAGLIIEVQAPLIVFREWHRHRTQSYNEMSARYTPMPDVNYLPTAERCMMVSGKNKQAGKIKGAKELTHEDALEWLAMLEEFYANAQELYERGLNMGIPKELARLPVPVGRYSKMRASANLRNWLAFLTLRSTLKGPGAQWEIRQFADTLSKIIQEAFPRTHELFVGEA